ncbi:TonB family protein [Aliamphritea ceti]|uniref:TonB family protein n=1 Tax=Aliamphritea ceti TaxID=1524258 RepID=UPI0021C31A47|nr:TonB family protein [Aliamphritea ceti]
MMRQMAFTPLAVLITLMLFLVMARLAGIGQPVEQVVQEVLKLNMQRLQFDDELQVRQREALTPPQLSQPQPRPDQPKIDLKPQLDIQPVAVKLDLPDIQMDMALKVSPHTDQLEVAKPTPSKPAKPESVAEPVETVEAPAPAEAQPSPVMAPSALSAELPMNVSAAPQVRINPQYPRRALRRKVQGYVIAEYEVDAGGNVLPGSFKIVESQPKKVFDKVVRRAVLGWRYAATGSAYRTRQRLEFQIKK